MALLSLHTGMRASEVFSLTYGDVDIKRKILTLRDTKSGKTRSAFMTDAVQKMFSDLARGKNSELVFPAHRCRKDPRQSLKANVAIWEVINKEIKLIEVTYAGTHEKAPY